MLTFLGKPLLICFIETSGTSFAPPELLSWWLGFRIRKGWLVQELPPGREKSARDTEG
jgi:hypothetical protein